VIQPVGFVFAVLLASSALAVVDANAGSPPEPADLIVRNAKVSTLDAAKPEADAFAVRGEKFIAVGTEQEVMPLRGDQTRVIDAGGRRVIPGLNDSHIHAVRAGRFFNLELRWDGVRSLARGLEMIRQQAERTPPGQWVRVIGGWSPYQFEERRMPTAAELAAAAPNTPVFVLFLYSQAVVNSAGVAALQLTPRSVPPAGGRYEFVEGGAILHAAPSPAILYTTIARLPHLSPEDQVNSTQHFYRELSRFGLTSVVDPGGGGHAYPADYRGTTDLVRKPPFPLRVSNFLFAQNAGSELASYEQWTASEKRNANLATDRLHGYVVEGAGENLVWSAGDYENFMAARPELAQKMETELTAVVRLLAEHQWPIRIHATYDETISRILDVFDRVFKETGYRARWCIDHAETISAKNLARIKTMGGGIAIQNRMAFAGEMFAERYGRAAAENAPPLRAMLRAGIPIGAGTDATRVSSHNPWLALHWLVTGKTIGEMPLLSSENRLSREEALRLYTIGSAWFSGEELEKGRIAPGQLADFAVLSSDYFAVPDDEIRTIESVLTVTGGDFVYSSGAFPNMVVSALPAVSPPWSPVAHFGGYQRGLD
jgi:predicted amidohydrolase YtcJ